MNHLDRHDLIDSTGLRAGGFAASVHSSTDPQPAMNTGCVVLKSDAGLETGEPTIAEAPRI